jgi:Protein of unknown function (DUF732)
MKPLLALIAVMMGIIFAVPAHSEPGIDEAPSNDNNATFLADLNKVGIGYSDPNQAVSAGQAVCACIHNGMSGLHLLKHLQENNPALTENGAAQFATISAKSYCPKQLDETEEPGGSKARTGGGGKSSGGD